MSPTSTMELMRSGASPEFVMVTVCGALGMPSPCGGKARLRGESSATAEVSASNLPTKASPAPPGVVWKGQVGGQAGVLVELGAVGKSEDSVDPVT